MNNGLYEIWEFHYILFVEEVRTLWANFVIIIFYIYYRACGATIVNRTDEIREEDVGTECGLFYIEKFGDE